MTLDVSIADGNTFKDFIKSELEKWFKEKWEDVIAHNIPDYLLDTLLEDVEDQYQDLYIWTPDKVYYFFESDYYNYDYSCGIGMYYVPRNPPKENEK